MTYRLCALGLVPPTKEIFGKLYGQCALAHECPRNVVCGYANSRRLVAEQTDRHADGEIGRAKE